MNFYSRAVQQDLIQEFADSLLPAVNRFARIINDSLPEESEQAKSIALETSRFMLLELFKLRKVAPLAVEIDNDPPKVPYPFRNLFLVAADNAEEPNLLEELNTSINGCVLNKEDNKEEIPEEEEIQDLKEPERLEQPRKRKHNRINRIWWPAKQRKTYKKKAKVNEENEEKPEIIDLTV